jgi:sigma-E factor negative regulatory protein RseB
MHRTVQVFGRRCALAALAALLPLASPALGADCAGVDPSVEQLLARLVNSTGEVAYSGVVTLQRGGDMQIIEVSHRVRGDVASDELSRLTGRGARVELSDHDVGCLHPGDQLMRSGLGQEGGLCELTRHYRFVLSPGERIAGREALRLRAEPLDMYRFGHVFEVDREFALMLRSTTLAADQRVLEQFQFASLDIGAASEGVDAAGKAVDSAAGAVEAAQRETHRARHPHPQEAADLPAGRPWELTWLPAGFVPTDAAPPASPRKSYTDGLASFSVFLEHLSRPLKPGEGVERQGSTVAYTRGMELQGEAVLVTVLGEVPTNTARMVADSVRMR